MKRLNKQPKVIQWETLIKKIHLLPPSSPSSPSSLPLPILSIYRRCKSLYKKKLTHRSWILIRLRTWERVEKLQETMEKLLLYMKFI